MCKYNMEVSKNSMFLLLLLLYLSGTISESGFSRSFDEEEEIVTISNKEQGYDITEHCPDSSAIPSNRNCYDKTHKSYKMGSIHRRERTFIMVKPDAVQRGLVGEIIKRFEQKGFKLVALKFQWANEELLKKHYEEHLQQPFFPKLLKYISSGPVVPMVWEGLDVVKTVRQMIGATNPANALPGTLRGDFCIISGRNGIHGSDSVESANREIALWFTDNNELVEWENNEEPWIYE